MTSAELERRDIFDDVANLEKYLIDAGFVDTAVMTRVIDVGDWRGGMDLVCVPIDVGRASFSACTSGSRADIHEVNSSNHSETEREISRGEY